MILVPISWTDKRLYSRMSVPGPLAHLRSGVSSQERWAMSVGCGWRSGCETFPFVLRCVLIAYPVSLCTVTYDFSSVIFIIVSLPH